MLAGGWDVTGATGPQCGRPRPGRRLLLQAVRHDPGQAPARLCQLRHRRAGARARLAEQGLPTAVEEHTACCYALQDKVWVRAPGGERWEIYTVLYDLDTPGCCTTGPEPEGSAARASSCR